MTTKKSKSGQAQKSTKAAVTGKGSTQPRSGSERTSKKKAPPTTTGKFMSVAGSATSKFYSRARGYPKYTLDVRRKNFNLSQALIDEAREALGAKTETEAIEEALFMATFSKNLVDGTRSLLGTDWVNPFGEEATASVEHRP